MRITALEKQLLEDIAFTDHSSDGHGFTAWVCEGYFSRPMRQVRALISTLNQKGILHHEPAGYGLPACICPSAAYVVESDEDDGNPFGGGRYGYRYTNLEWES